MSGKILIIDEQATNRIILKVKLDSARYGVVQAASAEEALACAARERPNLIIANSRLSGLSVAEFVQRLRGVEGCATTPIIILQAISCEIERRAALEASADDVLVKPVMEAVLLARLRNLLRQYHQDQDLEIQAIAALGQGFAEEQEEFDLPARVAIVASTRAEAVSLAALLGRYSKDQFSAIGTDQAMPRDMGQKVPDAYLLRIAMSDVENGLRLLADLKAAQQSRACPVIVLLDTDSAPLAVTLLDMGANDVITGIVEPEELALRLSHQLKRKRRCERMRAALLSGLKAAVRDPLTGAFNRRHALPSLSRMIDQGQNAGASFAVMLADIDYFKAVNDRYGHAAGDAVLCAVTDRLRSHLGENDLFARIGGEEFLIVTPVGSRASAQQIADLMCHIIGNKPFQVADQTEALHVTISIGVTMAVHRPGLPVPTVEGLLEEADRALYVAKAQGRNKATFCVRSAA